MEIRLREVSKELMKEAEMIQAHFNSATITGAVEQSLHKFNRDQVQLEQQRQQIRKLESALMLYQERELGVKRLLYSMVEVQAQAIRNSNEIIKDAKGIQAIIGRKHLPGTKKATRKARPARSAKPGKKIVPGKKKKGGKK